MGSVFSNQPVTKSTFVDNELRQGGDDLLTKDLDQLRSELPDGELKDLLIESIEDLQKKKIQNAEIQAKSA